MNAAAPQTADRNSTAGRAVLHTSKMPPRLDQFYPGRPEGVDTAIAITCLDTPRSLPQSLVRGNDLDTLVCATPSADTDVDYGENVYTVHPSDLTGIAIALADAFQHEERVALYGTSLSVLLQYTGNGRLFRAAHNLLMALREASADVHIHISRAAVGDMVFAQFASLFDEVVEEQPPR